MLELQAFCDESETDGQVSCIAGFWAIARAWERLEAAWNNRLRYAGLTEFHAVDCEQGKNEYADRSDRRDLQKDFTALAASTDLHGIFAVVDLRGWNPSPAIVDFLRSAYGTGTPYSVAFQQVLEIICSDVDNAEARRPDERVALVFDERPKESNIHRLHASLKNDPDEKFAVVHRRLGTLTFESSQRRAGLQAADLFAYEVNKHFVGVEYQIAPKDVRPQWKVLNRGRISGRHFNREKMPVLLQIMEQQWGPAALAYGQEQERAREDRAERGSRYRAGNSPPDDGEPA